MAEGGLSNDYVENVCKKLFGKSFLGVYPCDIHPKTRRKTFSVVFNTGDSSTSGEHFVCLYVTPTIIHYFDSFGKTPTDVNIKSFIKKQKQRRRLKHWKTSIQHETSDFCGFYVIGFLIHKYRNKKMFNKMFTSNLKENDSIIVNFIIKSI